MSAKLLERAKRVLAGGVSSEFRKYNHPHALFYFHGKGSRIYDADGQHIREIELAEKINRLIPTAELMQGIRDAAKETGHKLLVQGPGPMFNISFTDAKETNDYRATFSCNSAKLGSFIAGMHNGGVRIIGRGLWYISAVHTLEDINLAIEKVRKVLKSI